MEMIAQRCQVEGSRPVKQVKLLKESNFQTNNPESEWEQPLDDQSLRQIFCGLTGETG